MNANGYDHIRAYGRIHVGALYAQVISICRICASYIEFYAKHANKGLPLVRMHTQCHSQRAFIKIL